MKKIILTTGLIISCAFSQVINMDTKKHYWSETKVVKATKAWYNNKLIDIDKDDYSTSVGIFKGQEIEYKDDGKRRLYYSNGVYFELENDFLDTLKQERFQYKAIENFTEFAWIVYDKKENKYYLELKINEFQETNKIPYLVKLSLSDLNEKELINWIINNISFSDATVKLYNIKNKENAIKLLANNVVGNIFK